jgi:uracil-DNA glycosylase
MKTKEKAFNTLSQKISACTKCALSETCSRVVVGSGLPTAKILFIGEAPGKKEDEQGVPFVGASGKLLEEMLASIHIQRKDVYITNIVKCRPPENRDPLPEEITRCTPWLVAQIEAVDPALIITLGRYSMNFFLPELKISSAHGKAHTIKPEFLKKPYTFFTLYHPAAALYNGGLRSALLTDFKKIPRILHSINQKIDAE